MHRDMMENMDEEKSSPMIKKENIEVLKKIENYEIVDEEKDEMADEDFV
jgi:hypothetical protein